MFAIGLVISAVVALPVLMATTAYVVGAQFDWRRGLSEPVGHARGFYGVLAASIGLAFAVTLANISVIGMLVAASVIGGFGTPIGLVILVLSGSGSHGHGRPADLGPTGHRRLGGRRRRRRLRTLYTSSERHWASSDLGAVWLRREAATKLLSPSCRHATTSEREELVKAAGLRIAETRDRNPFVRHISAA